MSQSLSKIWTHLVFSTKERYPFLSDEIVRHDMHSYLAKILKANHCLALLVGGVSDHVHALFVLSKNHSIASIVWAIKFWNPFRVQRIGLSAQEAQRRRSRGATMR
jgi:putative transposase